MECYYVIIHITHMKGVYLCIMKEFMVNYGHMSEKNTKDAYNMYIYKVSEEENFMDLPEKLKHEPYFQFDIEKLFDILSKQFTSLENVLAVSDRLLQHTWLDIFLVAVLQQKEFFAQYFNGSKELYIKKCVEYLSYIMFRIDCFDEEQILNYKEEDTIFDSKRKKLKPSIFWGRRNEYEAIKIVLPDLASYIYSEAKSKYLNDKAILLLSGDFYNRFLSLKTVHAKKKLIEDLPCIMNVKDYEFETAPIVPHIKEITQILEKCIIDNDKFLIELTSDTILGILGCMVKDKENLKVFTNSLLDMLKKYNNDYLLNLSLYISNFK